MSGYNDTFDFNTLAGSHGMPGSVDAAPAPVMDQSGTATFAPSGLMEGDTAAPLHARLDFAPFEGVKSNGSPGLAHQITCAICLSTFQTVFALDNHAKDATHQAYKCKCGTGFNKNSTLQRHIATKDAPKTFACPLCDQKFNRQDKSKDHCRLHHKVAGEWLQALFNSRGSRPRAAPSRRRGAPVPLAAAPSAPDPTLPLVLAPAPAGLSVWSPIECTGSQYANLSAEFFARAGPLATTSPFVPTDSFGPSGAFAPAADPFAATAAPGEETTGTLDDIFGVAAWTTDFGGFNF